MLDRIIKLGDLAVTTSSIYTSQDHRDVHYLWKLRKALSIMCDETMLKVTEQELVDLHIAMVRELIKSGKGHWYDEYESSLDSRLPDDLKLASDGYYPPEGSGLLNLTESDLNERQLYIDHDAIQCWTAPTKRKDIPKSHFFDPKNKKYPYKDSNGKINCGGVLAAKQAAAGARSGKKASAAIRARINSVWKNSCEKNKKEKKEK